MHIPCKKPTGFTHHGMYEFNIIGCNKNKLDM